MRRYPRVSSAREEPLVRRPAARERPPSALLAKTPFGPVQRLGCGPSLNVDPAARLADVLHEHVHAVTDPCVASRHRPSATSTRWRPRPHRRARASARSSVARPRAHRPRWEDGARSLGRDERVERGCEDVNPGQRHVRPRILGLVETVDPDRRDAELRSPDRCRGRGSGRRGRDRRRPPLAGETPPSVGAPACTTRSRRRRSPGRTERRSKPSRRR